MPRQKIAGRTLHFLDSGTGQALLLLHAFPLSAAMWSRQVRALKADFRVVAPDLPGFGSSPPSGEPVTMGSFATLSLALLDALGIERATVLGLSMGGYVAFELHEQAPDRVKALVLCDTRATADTEDGRRAREATARALEEEGTVQPLVERMAPNLVSPAATPELRREVEKLIADSSAEGAAAAQRAMARRRDFSGRLAAIGCPTLLLVGSGDSITSPAEMQGLARAIPNAEYHVIPGAGHLSNLEQPKAFDELLAAFLRKVHG